MDYKIKMFKYLVSNICFITDNLLPNYLEKPVYYRFRDGPLAFTGKYIHTAYNYWILKNAGVSNIKLITSIDDMSDDDILFFHYEYADKIDFSKPYPKLQILSDKYRVEGADAYCVYDPSHMGPTDVLLYDPLPVGLQRKRTNDTPQIFHCNTSLHWMPSFLKDVSFLQQLQKENIHITFEHKRHYTNQDFDVFFFIRDISCLEQEDEDGSRHHKICHYKNAARLFQSWHMGVPGIFSHHPSMAYLKKTEYDYLEANTKDEFISKCRLLKTNNDYYKQMILNCDSRANEFTNLVIVEQISDIIKKYNKELVYEI